MLEHGGRLRAAAAHYDIPLSDWLDLSTGINPQAWPVPPVPADAWLRLPEDEDGLDQAAAAYYGCPAANLLALAGSQAAIQLLPHLFAPTRVAMLAPTYAEHPAAWQAAGHALCELPAAELLASDARIIVVGQPNNPTGSHFSPSELLATADRLAGQGGFLLIDEAFVDATPALSLAAHAGRPGLLILRSLGKFFGLAGARVGFLLADPVLLDRVREALGPWPVSGPARFAARLALADHAWQAAARQRLAGDSARLGELLAPLNEVDSAERRRAEARPTQPSHAPPAGTALFRWLPHPQAAALAEEFARQGILVRHFDHLSALRFGLPGTAADWQRLSAAIATISGRI